MVEPTLAEATVFPLNFEKVRRIIPYESPAGSQRDI